MVSTDLLVDTPVAPAPMHSSTEAFWRACALAQDIKRLKTEGPRINDLTVSHTIRRNLGEKGKEFEETYKWIPDNVIVSGGAYEVEEPQWLDLPQMSYFEFYQARRSD